MYVSCFATFVNDVLDNCIIHQATETEYFSLPSAFLFN